MPDRRDREHYDRPSWSEIDKRKDQSKHVDGGEPRRGLDDRKATTGYHRYKQELGDMFSTGEASKLVKQVMKKSSALRKEETASGAETVPERQALLRAIREASSSTELERLLDEFLGRWEMPEDLDFLTQALDHPEEEVQLEALGRISRYLDGHLPGRVHLLRSRVRALASRSEDPGVASLAKEVNRKLPA